MNKNKQCLYSLKNRHPTGSIFQKKTCDIHFASYKKGLQI